MEKKLVLNEVVTSPSSIFSKVDVIKLIDSIDENPIEVVFEMEVKQEPTVSLFDYLGYAAGARLGKEVAAAAAKCREKIASKQITTRTYAGNVLMYRSQFLKEFFDSKESLGVLDPSEIVICVTDIQNYKL